VAGLTLQDIKRQKETARSTSELPSLPLPMPAATKAKSKALEKDDIEDFFSQFGV
jgi:hypothetical protein